MEQLEETIWTLIQDGFTWQDAYTQCALQNMLLAFQQRYSFSPRFCEKALGVAEHGTRSSWRQKAEHEVVSVLQQLLQASDDERSVNAPDSNPGLSFLPSSYGRREEWDTELNLPQRMMDEEYARDSYPEEREAALSRVAPSYEEGQVDLPSSSDKRDEFVQVHKYFDQSGGQLKRDPIVAFPYPELASFPRPGSDEDDGGQRELRRLPDVPDMPQVAGEGTEEGDHFLRLPVEEAPVQDGKERGGREGDLLLQEDIEGMSLEGR